MKMLNKGLVAIALKMVVVVGVAALLCAPRERAGIRQRAWG